MTAAFEIPLVGAGGEPVDLARTISSHGLASLPPLNPGPESCELEVTLSLPKSKPRTVIVAPGKSGHLRIEVRGRAPGAAGADVIRSAVRHVLRMDEDLTPFYSVAAEDPELAWVTSGAGRMIQSQTVFEEIVKTVCTTNCAWSATVRMVEALVAHLGTPAAGAPAEGALGRTFPGPEAMAAADESFYREVVRAGYRGAYFVKLAEEVLDGTFPVEEWGRASAEELPDDELAELLRGLPGVGPYAAAHIMMMMGRYSRLILDSWTRPTYARIAGKKVVKDSTIERRFKRYGPYSGLAFWMVLTKEWVADPLETTP